LHDHTLLFVVCTRLFALLQTVLHEAGCTENLCTFYNLSQETACSSLNETVCSYYPKCIECVEGQLTYLNLIGQELTGKISTSIGSLTSLSWLNLANNGLNSTVPSEIGRLSLLTELGFNNNPNLHGTVPIEFGNLVNLADFHIDGCSLVGVVPPLGLFNMECYLQFDKHVGNCFDIDAGACVERSCVCMRSGQRPSLCPPATPMPALMQSPPIEPRASLLVAASRHVASFAGLATTSQALSLLVGIVARVILSAVVVVTLCLVFYFLVRRRIVGTERV